MATFMFSLINLMLLVTGTRAYFQYFDWYLNSTGLDYHINFCSRNCEGPTATDVTFWDPNCFPCSCSTLCQIYGTCCPAQAYIWAESLFDQVDTWYGADAKPEDKRDEIPMDDYRKFNCVHLDQERLVVASCPPSEPNQTLSNLCTQNLTYTVKGYTPVSHIMTGVTFRNGYCHQCNAEFSSQLTLESTDINRNRADNDASYTRPIDNDEGIVSWNIKVTCKHYQTLFDITTEDEFFRRAHDQSSICEIAMSMPENVPLPESCLPYWYDYIEPYSYIACDHPDLRLLSYCQHIQHPAFRTSFRRHNLFCALCDGLVPHRWIPDPSTTHHTFPTMATTTPEWRTSTIGSRGDPPSPLSLLLGISRFGGAEALPKCSNITWRNAEGDCEPASCSPGKSIGQNGTCSSVLTQIRGLGYRLAAVFVPEEKNVTMSEIIPEYLKENFRLMLKEISVGYEFKFNVIVERHNVTDEVIMKYLTVDANITASEDTPRDEYEIELLELVKGNWTVDLSKFESEILTLKAHVLGLEFFRWRHNHMNYTYVTTETFYSDFSSSTTGNRYYTPTTPPTTLRAQWESEILFSGKRQYTFYCSGPKKRESLWSVKNLFIDVTHSLVCPFVIVNLTDMKLKNDHILMTFENKGRAIKVSSKADVSLVDGNLQICLDLFKNLTRTVRNWSSDPLEEAQYYFEIVCVSISVACLLMSFLTYCLFPVLRSLPGLNNMSLCLSMALAHILLLITVRHGVTGDLGNTYCHVHAVALHYAWLATFLWMSVCCIHMYRVFTCQGTKFTNTASDKKRHGRYCVLAFGTPVIVIVLTMGLNGGLTSGQSFGYNDEICFLDTRTSILTLVLALFVPLCMTIVTNAVLFFLTIREIVHVTSLQKDKSVRERHGVITYVKLSTLTGLFCVVTAVTVQLGNVILNFLTSPLMALQGVFIFFSFTFNKRVGRLYCDLLGCQYPSWLEQTTTSGSNQKSSNSAEEERRTKQATQTSHI